VIALLLSSGGGGLGGLLGGLAGGAARSGGGGLAGMLGSALGSGGSGGGLGGLLSSLGGGQQNNAQDGLGGLLGQMMGGDTSAQPSAQQNSEAEIMIRAMINAAKSDGGVDETEQKKILEHLGDVSQEEIAFVQNEMAQPLNVDSFIQSIPKGLEQQVYVTVRISISGDPSCNVVTTACAQHADDARVRCAGVQRLRRTFLRLLA